MRGHSVVMGLTHSLKMTQYIEAAFMKQSYAL